MTKIEAIKALYDKDENEVIKIDNETLNGWSIFNKNGITMDINNYSDKDIQDMYYMEI